MEVVFTGARYGDLKPIGGISARVAIAVYKTDAGAEVKFKYSKNGKEWPPDSEAVAVGNLDRPKPLTMVVVGTVIEIFDGTKLVFKSMKGGIKGSW